MAEIPVELMIHKAIRGDAGAFAALMHTNAEYLTRTGHVYLTNDSDVQEAISETVIIALRGISKLHEPAYFRTWLTRILIRQCYKRYAVGTHETVGVEHLPDVGEPAATQATDAHIDIMNGIRTLNNQNGQVLLMYYYQGMSIREIGGLTNTPVNTVKSQLRRGKEQLKQWLGSDYFAE